MTGERLVGQKRSGLENKMIDDESENQGVTITCLDQARLETDCWLETFCVETIYTRFKIYLGPGKGPGSSFKHPSTRNISQQQHAKVPHLSDIDAWYVTVPGSADSRLSLDSLDDRKTAKRDLFNWI